MPTPRAGSWAFLYPHVLICMKPYQQCVCTCIVMETYMDKETPPPPSTPTGLTQPTQPAQPTAIGVGTTPPEWGEKGRSSVPDEPPPFVPVDDGTLNDKEWKQAWDLF